MLSTSQRCVGTNEVKRIKIQGRSHVQITWHISNYLYLLICGREIFIRIHQSLRVKDFLDPSHHIDILFALRVFQVLVLRYSQPMFRGY